MTWLFLLAVVFGLLYAATRYDFSFRTWTGIIAATLLVLTFIGSYPTALMLLLWIVFLPIAIILNVDTLRRQMLSGPVLKSIRKKLPPMSDTEREAIEAGTVWWEAELFRGNPDFSQLHAYPKPELSKEEQAFVDGSVEKTLPDD